jgi:hypothetical protein
MTKRNLYKNGSFLRTLTDDDDSYILKDGESIRVPLNMMDSVQRVVLQDSLTPTEPRSAPGYIQMADSEYEDRELRHFDRKQRLSDAWKQTPPLAPAINPVKSADNQPPLMNEAEAAYDRRNAALERAYLGGA